MKCRTIPSLTLDWVDCARGAFCFSFLVFCDVLSLKHFVFGLKRKATFAVDPKTGEMTWIKMRSSTY